MKTSAAALEHPPEVDPTDFANAAINHKLTPEEKIHLLDQMVRIRRFE